MVNTFGAVVLKLGCIMEVPGKLLNNPLLKPHSIKQQSMKTTDTENLGEKMAAFPLIHGLEIRCHFNNTGTELPEHFSMEPTRY